jgi:hypothetical protein
MLSGVQYIFDVRWNARDAAWYFDLLAEDETPIRSGIKIVLGTSLGSSSTAAFFQNNILVAVDLSNGGRDAELDDLGTRVRLLWSSLDDLALS